jgi:hypothetical protein
MKQSVAAPRQTWGRDHGALKRRVWAQTETLRATLEATADGILVVNFEGKRAGATMRRS